MKTAKLIIIELAATAAISIGFYAILAAAAWIENGALWNRIFDFIFR